MENIKTENAVDMDQKTKDQIKQDIIAELEKTGIRVIENNYSGKAALLRLLDKFQTARNEYEEEYAKIIEKYSQKVSIEKLKDLQAKFEEDRKKMLEELSNIENENEAFKIHQAREIQNSSEYKEIKNYTLNLFIHLGNKLEPEIIYELVKPIIEAQDLLTLKILNTCVTNSNLSYILAGSIRKVEEYFADDLLKAGIREVRKYMSSTKKEQGYDLRNILDLLKNK